MIEPFATEASNKRKRRLRLVQTRLNRQVTPETIDSLECFDANEPTSQSRPAVEMIDNTGEAHVRTTYYICRANLKGFHFQTGNFEGTIVTRQEDVHGFRDAHENLNSIAAVPVRDVLS